MAITRNIVIPEAETEAEERTELQQLQDRVVSTVMAEGQNNGVRVDRQATFIAESLQISRQAAKELMQNAGKRVTLTIEVDVPAWNGTLASGDRTIDNSVGYILSVNDVKVRSITATAVPKPKPRPRKATAAAKKSR